MRGNLSVSSLSNKQYRNSRAYNPYRDYTSEQGEDEVRWGLRRAGSWPSDWVPRRVCNICKKEFRTDSEEGFSDWAIDICASCIHQLVKKEMNKAKAQDVYFEQRIDQIGTQ